MVKVTSEQILEENLITQLTQGISQWTYREDLKTEEDLWQNFRDKLEQNNQDVLEGTPLTEQEFRQIQNQLNFPSFFKGAEWLAGENGTAKVEVQREDASLGTIRLKVIKREDVSGGTSSYEVINQFESSRSREIDQNRRFDVSLLINGLPLIHIELKNRSHSYMEAFHQIKKYLREDKFRGIYSCIQMFVVTNGSDTRYIASAKDTNLNEQFLTRWVDEKNQPVNDYLAFSQDVLSIPMAHKMVTHYTVMDNERKSIIILRPYQIHAIEAIRKASGLRKSGYVWHTTGSGKTLTSYKVARNLLHIPSIDKTIFIVDRVDLDQQTTSSFTSYAKNDVIDIDETSNVNELIKKLLSEERNMIVTTIQKLNHVMRRFEDKKDAKNYQKLRHLNIAFVVDECHRAISSVKKREIERFFSESLWYGFTGTPIFAENAKKAVGNLPRTTEEQYGVRLHEYTVKEAINDHAVLGFQVEYKTTLDEEMLDQILFQAHPELEKQLDELTVAEKEFYLPKEMYLDERHMLEVIHSIVNKSRRKLGFMGNNSGETFCAILTTSSINQAQRYYDLFKKVKEGSSSVEISEETKRVLPDFPKLAITYSISENEEASLYNQEKMKEVIKDYNHEFGTHFTMETMRGYNRNINDRLARKSNKYLKRSEQLDLVIVVDRLLTGFDAPCLSTLFIDRPPMQPHDLIQAFSRTNRLFVKQKKYGQVVTFQKPSTFENKVNDALVLYSNGGENDVLAPKWEEAYLAFSDGLKELREVVSDPKDFDVESKSKLKLLKFIKAFQTVDRTLASIQVYSEFEEDMLENEFNFSLEIYEEYEGKYQNALAKIKIIKPEPEEIEINVSYELESVREEEINYEYLLLLIQSFVPSGSDEYELLTQADRKAINEIEDYIASFKKTNQQKGELIEKIWQEVLANPELYRDQNISTVFQSMIYSIRHAFVSDFSERWKVKEDQLNYVVDNYQLNRDRQFGEAELRKTSDYDLYRESTEDPVNKLRYWKVMRRELDEKLREEIIPLQR